MWWVSVLAGVALLAVTAVDVFSTVFIPRGGAGWLTSRLYRGVWRGWSAAACAGGRRRRRLLALAGPLLLPLTVAMWVGAVVLSFALIYLPFQEQLTVPGSSDSSWVSALYVSAYSATTLGVGDVYASTGPLRLLVTLEAAVGFAVFSASITYVLSVYSALLRATSLALSITTYVGRQANEDGVDVLCRSIRTGSEIETLSWLGQMVIEITGTSQAQRQYPLVAYFHIPRDDRALPLALSDLLGMLTVCRSVLDTSAYPSLSSSPTTVAAWRAATAFVDEHGSELGEGQPRDGVERGQREYERARARLVAASVSVRDEQQARADFLRLLETWEAGEYRLLRHFRYRT
jgi:hypothetical protein